MPRSWRPARGAFTTIELMVVVVILGLVGGVAYVTWERVLPSQKLNTAVRNLSEVLHETRAQAIAHSKRYEIHYDLTEERYFVGTPFREVGGGYAAKDEERMYIHRTDLLEAGVTIERLIAGGNEYESGIQYIEFSPLGAAAAHCIVLHQESTDRYFTIEVMPLTGEIRFHDDSDGMHIRDPVDEPEFDE